MILKSLKVEPEATVLHFGTNQVEEATGRNTVIIEVECSDTECDQLYRQFKGDDSHEV